MFATQTHRSRIEGGDASKEVARRSRAGTGATKLVIGLVAGVMALSATLATPAMAAPVLPRHEGYISFCAPDSVTIAAYTYERSTTYRQPVAWLGFLQRWDPVRGWYYVSAPNTATWKWNAAGAYAPAIWGTPTITVLPGYWYRLASQFYWDSIKYYSPLEYSTPCHAEGWGF